MSIIAGCWQVDVSVYVRSSCIAASESSNPDTELKATAAWPATRHVLYQQVFVDLQVAIILRQVSCSVQWCEALVISLVDLSS